MQSSKSQRVLVVEDEGLIALDIAGRLEALGHTVIATVGTADEAVACARDADIVVMDIRLDGHSDGIEAASRIRDQYHVPVVFLTGQADRSTLDRAKLAEPYGYIVKPLAPTALQTSIEIAIYKHGMERMLAEREAWLSTTLTSVADAVIVTDVHSRVRMLNRAAEALTGWTQPDAAGQHVSKVVHLVDKESDHDAEDLVPLAILRDAPTLLETARTLVTRGGREMWVEGSASPAKASGAIVGVVITLRDVSARGWEERQIRQCQRLEATGRLAAGVSNDYANLLSIIRSQSDQLLRHVGGYSPARRAAEEIQRAAAEAEQITRRLASFSTRQVSHQEVLSLNSILRRVSKIIESVAGPTVEVTTRPQVTTGKIKADAGQIEQVIMTLVMHACANMPNGGRLLIETGNAELPLHGRAAGYAMLAVTHNGPENDLERLFEPRSSTDDGLALSLVHTIVTEHAGYVSAQATAAEECRFEVLLPRWNAPTLLPRPKDGEAPSILLIENRDNIRLQLHNFFEAHGYNLLEAADVEEALALAEMHDGALRLLIAGSVEAETIERNSPSLLAGVAVLRITEGAENSLHEIQRPFTQRALLARVESMLNPPAGLESAAAG
jgi:PAS domain S-box-containing protein